MNKQSDTEQLIQRFLNNASSPEEQEQLQEYFERYDLTEEKPEAEHLYYPADWQSDRMHKAVLSTIGEAKPHRSIPMTKWLRSAAAVLIPLMALTIVLIRYTNSGKKPVAALTRIENAAQTVRYLRLSDSSEIWLNKGASIVLDEKGFASNRNITLNGEAYFQVTHDAVHPFSVRAGDLSTIVLGTSFSIKAAPGAQQTTVALISGKVKVAQEGSPGRILTPGQSVIYDHNTKSMQAANLPFWFLAWKNKELTCNKEPLENIVQYLSSYYSRQIRLSPGSKALTYSGSLTLESNLSIVLNRLLFVHQLRYKISGNEVLIY
ncbi:MAG: FecR domain-containing protein [Chitinophagaceae bacterium]|nr:FecR domain-containing protein [Chitinophagaceae bacterium]